VVFCKNCKYYRKIFFNSMLIDTKCLSKNNIKYIRKYNTCVKIYKKEPEVINSTNSCSWYKENLTTKIRRFFSKDKILKEERVCQ